MRKAARFQVDPPAPDFRVLFVRCLSHPTMPTIIFYPDHTERKWLQNGRYRVLSDPVQVTDSVSLGDVLDSGTETHWANGAPK